MPPLRPPGIAAPLSDLIAVAVVIIFGVLPFPEDVFRAQGLLLVVALLPAAVMPFRRRWPLAALGISLLCAVALALGGVMSPSALIGIAISAFSVTDRRGRAVGILWLVPAAIVVFFSNSLPLGGDLFDARALQFILFIAVAAAFGDATRSRRVYATAMAERAERAERGREDEARRRVTEERVRIARDLHDVVAHQISVISLNAGVASSSLATRPDRARDALSTIRSASRTVLADIGGLMALLRSDDSGELRELAPQAGLKDLDELLTGFAGFGLRVDLQRELGSVALSPASDHVAYLVVQEGLTNAHKHGVGHRAALALRARGSALAITISNPKGAGTAGIAPGGHGLTGLRERVAAVRGLVTTSHVNGTFRLEVLLPVEGQDAR